MGDTASTTSTLDNLLKNYHVPTALLTVYNETPLYPLFKKYPQPKGQGKITYWNAWTRMAGASVSISEGGTPSVPSLSSRRVSATIAQYGRGYKITDLAEFMSLLDTREGAMKQLRNSAKETQEYICHMGIFKSDVYVTQHSVTTLLSGYMSSVASAFCSINGTHNAGYQFEFPAVFSTSCTRLSAVLYTAPSQSAQLSIYGVRKAVLQLEKKNIGTYADGYYVGYTHPNAIYSLRKDQNWNEWNKYTNSKETLYAGEVGKIYRVRFITSSLCPRYAVTAHSVVPCFIFGEEAVGVTEALGGLEMNSTSGADSGNPFATFQYVTYKLTGAAACLNPSAGVILWCHEFLK